MGYDRPLLQNIDGAADIILVNVPYTSLHFPNNGIAHICETIKSSGFKPVFADINIAIANRHENDDSEIKKYSYLSEETMNNWAGAGDAFSEILNVFGDDFEEAAEQIISHSAQIVGFSVNTFNLTTANWIAKRIREKAPEKIIIYGGCSCYDEGQCRTLSDMPDYICVGDGEITAPELLSALLNGRDPGLVPGVMEIRRGSKRYTPGIRHDNLNNVKWPKWEEYNLSQYHLYVNETTLLVSPTRGCGWGRCNFCTEQNGASDLRTRKAESVMEEIRYNYVHNNVTSFLFTDLKVNSNHDELERLCELIIESDLRLRIVGQFHVDKRLTVRLMTKMKRAGFPAIHFGLETGSNTVMKLMRKGYNVKLAEECFVKANQAGLPVNINLMVGFPGETMNEINETCEFLERNAKYLDLVDDVHICHILFGSPLWYDQEKFGVILGEGNKSKDWVSVDGSNTYANRVLRRETVIKKILALGLSLSQWQRMPDGKVVDKSEIFSKPYEANLANLKSLPRPSKVLVFRSCPIDVANKLIDNISDLIPGIRVDVLMQEEVKMQISHSDVIDEKYIYPGGTLSLENILPETIATIYAKSYDWVIIPTGDMSLTRYNHVFDVARKTGAGSMVIITRDKVIVKDIQDMSTKKVYVA